MIILAVDPGNTESAWMRFDTVQMKILNKGKCENEKLLDAIKFAGDCVRDVDHLTIEMVACYGMPVGAEVFDTCVWIGRFKQAFIENQLDSVSSLFRMEEKMALCHNSRAKDANIRQALIDLYGGKDKAIGKSKTPGPLYGISGDLWAALAVAVTFTKKLNGEHK